MDDPTSTGIPTQPAPLKPWKQVAEESNIFSLPPEQRLAEYDKWSAENVAQGIRDGDFDSPDTFSQFKLFDIRTRKNLASDDIIGPSDDDIATEYDSFTKSFQDTQRAFAADKPTPQDEAIQGEVLQGKRKSAFLRGQMFFNPAVVNDPQKYREAILESDAPSDIKMFYAGLRPEMEKSATVTRRRELANNVITRDVADKVVTAIQEGTELFAANIGTPQSPALKKNKDGIWSVVDPEYSDKETSFLGRANAKYNPLADSLYKPIAAINEYQKKYGLTDEQVQQDYMESLIENAPTSVNRWFGKATSIEDYVKQLDSTVRVKNKDVAPEVRVQDPNLFFDPEGYNAAVDKAKAPDEAKNLAKEARTQFATAVSGDIYNNLLNNRDDFREEYAKDVADRKDMEKAITRYYKDKKDQAWYDDVGEAFGQAGTALTQGGMNLIMMPSAIKGMFGSVEDAEDVRLATMVQAGEMQAEEAVANRTGGAGFIKLNNDVMRIIPDLAVQMGLAVGTGWTLSGTQAAILSARTGIGKAAAKAAIQQAAITGEKAALKSQLLKIIPDLTGSAADDVAEEALKMSARAMSNNPLKGGVGTQRAIGSAYAGLTSASSTFGQVYTDVRKMGKSPEEAIGTARTAAIVAGAITSGLTHSFGMLGNGGVEDFASMGRKAGEFTIKDIVNAGLADSLSTPEGRQLIRNIAKSFGRDALSEGAEEGLDQALNLISQYATNPSPEAQNRKATDIINESLYATLLGGIAGGGAASVGQARATAPGVTAQQIQQEVLGAQEPVALDVAPAAPNVAPVAPTVQPSADPVIQEAKDTVESLAEIPDTSQTAAALAALANAAAVPKPEFDLPEIEAAKPALEVQPAEEPVVQPEPATPEVAPVNADETPIEPTPEPAKVEPEPTENMETPARDATKPEQMTPDEAVKQEFDSRWSGKKVEEYSTWLEKNPKPNRVLKEEGVTKAQQSERFAKWIKKQTGTLWFNVAKQRAIPNSWVSDIPTKEFMLASKYMKQGNMWVAGPNSKPAKPSSWDAQDYEAAIEAVEEDRISAQSSSEAFNTYLQSIEKAISENRPVSVAAMEYAQYKTIPEGYVKQGELYVYQPEQKAEAAVKEVPAATEAIVAETPANPRPDVAAVRAKIKEAGSTYDKVKLIEGMISSGEFIPAVIEAAETGDPLPVTPKDVSIPSGVDIPKTVSIDRIKVPVIKQTTPEKAVENAVSKDETRFILNGVFLDAESQKAVASDGRMIIVAPAKVTGESRIIAVKDIKKTDFNPEVKKGGEIPGSFPNWRQVTPKPTSKSKAVNTDEILRASVVLLGVNKAMPAKGSVSALLQFGGAYFNPEYIKKAVTGILQSGAKSITYQLDSEIDPILLTGDNGAFAVVMPVRLPNDAKIISYKLGKQPQPTKQDAVQEQSPDASVLRQEGQEVGLPKVDQGGRGAEQKTAGQEGEVKAELTREQEEVVVFIEQETNDAEEAVAAAEKKRITPGKARKVGIAKQIDRLGITSNDPDSVIAALEKIANNPKPKPSEKHHARIAKDLLSVLKDSGVQIQLVSGNDARMAKHDSRVNGWYDPKTNTAYINLDGPHELGIEETILHELVHASGEKVIQNPQTDAQKRILADLEKQMLAARKNAIALGRAKLGTDVTELGLLTEMTAAQNDYGLFDILYGVSSLSEYHAHATTSRSFQKFLATYKEGGKRSLMERFINSIASLLSGKKTADGSDAEKAYATLLDLMRENKGDVRLSNADVVQSRARGVSVEQDAEYLELAKDPEKNAEALQAMVDEAAKAAGGQLVFHGGDIEGDVIDVNRRERGAESERRAGTFYASSNPDTAKTYPGKQQRLFFFLRNPFRIGTPEMRPASWTGDTAVRAGGKVINKKTSLSIGEAVDRAKQFGYDGVIYDNIVDTGRLPSQSGKPPIGSTYVAFNSEQIKSAAPVTRDDNGNVIPLSQRFQSTSQDIRFSRARGTGEDAAFAELEQRFKAGDKDAEEEARKLIEKMAKEQGWTEKAYHGTPGGGFTVFDIYGSRYGLMGQGAYFTNAKDVAQSYADKQKRNVNPSSQTPQVYEVFLKPGRVLDMEAPVDKQFWLDAFGDYLTEDSLSAAKTNEDAFRAMEEELAYEELPMSEGAEIVTDGLMSRFDSVTHIGGKRIGKGENLHNVTIVFNSEQIKSADPFTYDDAGNLILPSERFQPESPDIRFSRARSIVSDTVTKFAPEFNVVDDKDGPAVFFDGRNVTVNPDALENLDEYEAKDLSERAVVAAKAAPKDPIAASIIQQTDGYSAYNFDSSTRKEIRKSLAKAHAVATENGMAPLAMDLGAKLFEYGGATDAEFKDAAPDSPQSRARGTEGVAYVQTKRSAPRLAAEKFFAGFRSRGMVTEEAYEIFSNSNAYKREIASFISFIGRDFSNVANKHFGEGEENWLSYRIFSRDSTGEVTVSKTGFKTPKEAESFATLNRIKDYTVATGEDLMNRALGSNGPTLSENVREKIEQLTKKGLDDIAKSIAAYKEEYLDYWNIVMLETQADMVDAKQIATLRERKQQWMKALQLRAAEQRQIVDDARKEAVRVALEEGTNRIVAQQQFAKSYLPDDLVHQIERSRTKIDELSGRLTKIEWLMDGSQLQMIIDAKTGVYVTRSYEAFETHDRVGYVNWLDEAYRALYDPKQDHDPLAKERIMPLVRHLKNNIIERRIEDLKLENEQRQVDEIMADLMTDPRQVTQVEMVPGQSTEGTEYEELVRAVANRELLRRRSEEKKDFIRRAMRSLALNGFASNIRNARKRLPVLRKEANRLYDQRYPEQVAVAGIMGAPNALRYTLMTDDEAHDIANTERAISENPGSVNGSKIWTASISGTKHSSFYAAVNDDFRRNLDFITGAPSSKTGFSGATANDWKRLGDKILEHKNDVPAFLRTFLGERDNPLLRVSDTLLKQSHLIAVGELFQNLSETGQREGWLVNNELRATDAEKYKGWDTILTSEQTDQGYEGHPFKGLYADPVMADAIRVMLAANEPSNTAFKAVAKIVGFALWGVTAGSVKAIIRNLASAPSFLLNSGFLATILDPRRWRSTAQNVALASIVMQESMSSVAKVSGGKKIEGKAFKLADKAWTGLLTIAASQRTATGLMKGVGTIGELATRMKVKPTSEAAQQFYSLAVRLGVANDNVQKEAMERLLSLEETISRQPRDKNLGRFARALKLDGVVGFGSYLLGTIKSAGQQRSQLYGAPDDFTKILAWLNEMDSQARIHAKDTAQYNEWKGADGLFTNMPENLVKLAADHTTDTIQSHSKVWAHITQFKKLGFGVLLAPFVAARAEFYRNAINSYRIGFQEIRSKNTKERAYGITRIASAVLAHFVYGNMAGAALKMIFQAFADDEDLAEDSPEKREAIRKLGPEYAKNKNATYVVYKNGTFDWLDISFSDPFSFVSSSLNAARRGIDEKAVDDHVAWSVAKELMAENFGTFVSPQIAVGASATMISGYDPVRGIKIWDSQADTTAEKVQKAIAYYAKQAGTPGDVKSAMNIIKAARGIAENGRQYKLGTEIGGVFLGASVRTIKVTDMVEQKLAQAKNNLNTRVGALYEAQLNDSNIHTDEDFVGAAETYHRVGQDAIRRMQKVWKAGETLLADTPGGKKMLNAVMESDKVKMSEVIERAIKTGKNVPSTLSPQTEQKVGDLGKKHGDDRLPITKDTLKRLNQKP